QSTASISACQRSIGLFKSVEQAWLQSLRHANAGIDDLETDPRYVRASGRTERHPYFNTAVLGELHRIAGQIQQDLPHAPVIAMQAVGHTGLDEHPAVQSLVARLWPENQADGLDQFRQREVACLHAQ